MDNLIVKCKKMRDALSIDVDLRFYKEDGTPIMTRGGVNRDGKLYHAGQISSNFDWAIKDAHEHFETELKEQFPDGYTLQFEFYNLIGDRVNLNDY